VGDVNNSLVDLGELSKPANTLIEKISQAVGGFFKPWQIRRVAKAEADAALIAAEKEIQITDLHYRAVYRWLDEEARKQQNMENITRQAIPLLNENSEPEKIANDWITNFFDKTRIISDSEMQELLAHILAGEANKPGSYSKRTVNTLNDLDKNDVDVFIKLCDFCCRFPEFTLIVFDLDDKIYSDHGLNFEKLAHLNSIGLITFDNVVEFKKLGFPNKFSINYYGEFLYLTMPKDSDNELAIGKVILTKVGEELAPICVSQPIAGFIEYLKGKWSAFSPSDVA
jgi:hypothetical protein